MNDLNKLDDFFVTSDTWFGRNNILYAANRISQFSSIENMNNSLIKNWNKKVKKDDVVIHLGNFAWDPMIASKVLDKLNGHIYFICSNDDAALLKVAKNYNNVNIFSNQIIVLSEHDTVLSHYPITVWPGKETGTIHMHGHTVYSHKTNLKIENRINVCTDFWGFSPIKFSTIKEIINEND
jgi:calcineurin-like phosphoesterase family protein